MDSTGRIKWSGSDATAQNHMLGQGQGVSSTNLEPNEFPAFSVVDKLLQSKIRHPSSAGRAADS